MKSITNDIELFLTSLPTSSRCNRVLEDVPTRENAPMASGSLCTYEPSKGIGIFAIVSSLVR